LEYQALAKRWSSKGGLGTAQKDQDLILKWTFGTSALVGYVVGSPRPPLSANEVALQQLGSIGPFF